MLAHFQIQRTLWLSVWHIRTFVSYSKECWYTIWNFFLNEGNQDYNTGFFSIVPAGTHYRHIFLLLGLAVLQNVHVHCTAYYNWMIKVFSVEFTVITCYNFLNAIHALSCSSCYVLIVLTLSQKNCASPHSKPRLSFGGSACRVYTIGARKTRQTRTLLEKFWRISLYVTDDAIAKRSATLIFVK